MKINTGFVSNSSTTSFCIFGIQREVGDLSENLPTDRWNLGEFLEDEGFNVGWSYNDDYITIGMEAHLIPRDKTLVEIEKTLKEKFKKVGIETDEQLGWHEDAYRDG